jgi:MFS family permease
VKLRTPSCKNGRNFHGYGKELDLTAASKGLPVAKSSSARLVVLLAFVLFINFVDRGNLATAAPLIKDELHLNSTQLGLLLSAFFWSYTLCLFPVGWLAERFGAKPVLTVGVAIWSLGTVLTGVAGGLYSLFAYRLLLGIGESTAFPCTSKLLASELSVTQRGRANGVTTCGQGLGPAFGTWVGGLIASMAGWRPLFIIFGALSLLWVLPWRRTKLSSAPVHDNKPTAPLLPLRSILRQRAMWATAVGHFGANYGLYFVGSWLPTYLIKVKGLSVAQMATTAGAIYVVWALSSLTIGWAFDRLQNAGACRTMTSKTLLGIGCAGKITCMAGIIFAPPTWAIPLLFVNEIFSGFISPILWTVSQTIAGPRAIGRWMGVQMTVGNIAGVVAPVLTGIAIDLTGSFAAAFAAAALFYVMSGIAWIFGVDKVEPLVWELVPLVPLARPGSPNYAGA